MLIFYKKIKWFLGLGDTAAYYCSLKDQPAVGMEKNHAFLPHCHLDLASPT
jgi:hypothetical protein